MKNALMLLAMLMKEMLMLIKETMQLMKEIK